MKKIALLFVWLSLFFMNGCIQDYYYDYTELIDSVKQVYVVEIERSEYYGDVYIECLKEIKDDDFDNLLQELSGLRYEYSPFLEPKNNVGQSIMLIYDSTDYDFGIVGPNGIEKFKSNQEVEFLNARCDEKQLSLLINKYYVD